MDGNMILNRDHMKLKEKVQFSKDVCHSYVHTPQVVDRLSRFRYCLL